MKEIRFGKLYEFHKGHEFSRKGLLIDNKLEFCSTFGNLKRLTIDFQRPDSRLCSLVRH